MKKSMTMLTIAATTTALVAGCAAPQTTGQGVGAGAGIGALVGAGLGQAIGRDTRSTLIGAAAGAALGAGVGCLVTADAATESCHGAGHARHLGAGFPDSGQPPAHQHSGRCIFCRGIGRIEPQHVPDP